LASAAQESTRFAKLDFGRVNSIFDIVTIFRERAAMRFRRFSLENYFQTHLAWGLSLIAVGISERASSISNCSVLDFLLIEMTGCFGKPSWRQRVWPVFDRDRQLRNSCISKMR
jgi:hypothetical protein